jgi:hypothetical protein
MALLLPGIQAEKPVYALRPATPNIGRAFNCIVPAENRCSVGFN